MKLSLILLAAALASCSTPQVAPRFKQPSTAVIEAGNRAAGSSVKRAQTKLIALEKENPQLKLQIASVQQDLIGAVSSLGDSEVARVALDQELKSQTATANKLAYDYDKDHKKMIEQEKIIKQVNRFWGLGAFVYGFGVLFKHLLILVAVIAVLAIALWMLSFLFPIIGIFLASAGAIVRRIWIAITGRL